jgi:hypothetical protein
MRAQRVGDGGAVGKRPDRGGAGQACKGRCETDETDGEFHREFDRGVERFGSFEEM